MNKYYPQIVVSTINNVFVWNSPTFKIKMSKTQMVEYTCFLDFQGMIYLPMGVVLWIFITWKWRTKKTEEEKTQTFRQNFKL